MWLLKAWWWIYQYVWMTHHTITKLTCLLALEDDQTQLMDTSDDSFSSVNYDPRGTELILPLKKRKLILRNPEKTVTELWKQDVLS